MAPRSFDRSLREEVDGITDRLARELETTSPVFRALVRREASEEQRGRFLALHRALVRPLLGMRTRLADVLATGEDPELQAIGSTLLEGRGSDRELEASLVAELRALWRCDAAFAEARADAFEAGTLPRILLGVVETALVELPLAVPAPMLLLESIVGRALPLPATDWSELASFARLRSCERQAASFARVAAATYRELYAFIDQGGESSMWTTGGGQASSR
jgi:hypothetical protein